MSDLFGNYSSFSLTDREGSSTSSASYNVIYSPKTGASLYKANMTAVDSNGRKSALIWIRPNGTILAFYEFGQNATGGPALVAANALSFLFAFEAYRPNLLPFYQASSFVHVINQTSIFIGGTKVDVTNYGANSLPFTVSFCQFSQTLTTFFFQVGQVTGTNPRLVTLLELTGHETTPTGTFGFDETITITAITKA